MRVTCQPVEFECFKDLPQVRPTESLARERRIARVVAEMHRIDRIHLNSQHLVAGRVESEVNVDIVTTWGKRYPSASTFAESNSECAGLAIPASLRRRCKHRPIGSGHEHAVAKDCLTRQLSRLSNNSTTPTELRHPQQCQELSYLKGKDRRLVAYVSVDHV